MRPPSFSPVSRPFPKVDFLMHFGRPLAHFWLPLAHFWRPLAPFWLPLAPLWLPFGSLLVPFGSLLVALGSLLVTLALDFLTFGASWCHFLYFYIFSIKTLCKLIFLGKCPLKFRFFWLLEALSAKSPRTIPGTLSFVPHLPRPGAGILP